MIGLIQKKKKKQEQFGLAQKRQVQMKTSLVMFWRSCNVFLSSVF